MKLNKNTDPVAGSKTVDGQQQKQQQQQIINDWLLLA